MRSIVVGNSASVLGRGLGETIEAADIVIRCNGYQLNGFRDDVGSKVTHWAACICDALPLALRQDGIPPGLSASIEMWPVGINGKPAERGDVWRELMLLVPMGPAVDLTYHSLADDVLADLHSYGLINRHRQPTTGMFAVARAMGFEGEHRPGFERDHRPVQVCGLQPAGGHYWRQHPGGVSHRHSLVAEQALLDRWESHGRVIRLDM